MPEISSKNQPQLVNISIACRCISKRRRAVICSASFKSCVGVRGEKFCDVFRRTVENDGNIFVARQPGVCAKIPSPCSQKSGRVVAQPVKRIRATARAIAGSSRHAPELQPQSLLPAFDAVRTTPGAGLMNFRLVRGRMLFQKLGIDRQFRLIALFNLMQRIRERHVAILKMMAVGFAIRGDMDELVMLRASSRAPSRRPANVSPLVRSFSNATACATGAS